MFKKLHSQTNFFIVALTSMDLFTAIAFLISVDPKTPPGSSFLCPLQGYLINWSLLTESFYCSSLMTHLMFSLAHPNDKDVAAKYLIYFNIGITIIIAIISTLPLYLGGENSYRYLAAHCWIGHTRHIEYVEQLWLMYFWIWLNIGIIIVQVIRIRYHYFKLTLKFSENQVSTVRNPVLLQTPDTHTAKRPSLWAHILYRPNEQMSPVMVKLLKTVRILSFYPIVEVIAWMPITIYRVITVFDTHYKNIEFEAAGVSVVVCAGFLNAIIFFLHSKNQAVLKPYFEGIYQRIASCTGSTNRKPDTTRISGSTADFELDNNIKVHNQLRMEARISEETNEELNRITIGTTRGDISLSSIETSQTISDETLNDGDIPLSNMRKT